MFDFNNAIHGIKTYWALCLLCCVTVLSQLLYGNFIFSLKIKVEILKI